MAMLATNNYPEHHQYHHHYGGKQYETDEDEVSTTLTYQSGYSSEYRHYLPRINRHNIKIKSSSSFPNLLSLYETPIKEESNIADVDVQKKKKTHRKRQRKHKESKHADYEDPIERRTRHETRQLRVDAVAREQLDKFDNYVKSMRDKVEKQREERKKYNEILQERLREQEELERQKLRLHRGPKHVYVHDKKYLKSLPVSNYCKATRLADELQRKGVLRTRGDLEKYWSNYTGSQRKSIDIFAETDSNSVNYPQKWMGTNHPEIKVTNDDADDEMMTEAVDLHHRKLPPLKKKKKKSPVI